MKYEFIEKHKEEFGILRMCRALEVKRSGYYAWRKRGPSNRARENSSLLFEIRVIHLESKGIYGSPKIWVKLKGKGIKCGHNRVVRIMRENNIYSKIRKKYRKRSQTVTEGEAFKNLLNREFNPAKPNMIWATDLTHIPTMSGWVYACVFIDLYSRMVVGWSVSSTMKTEMVLSAFEMALRNRMPGEGLIIHSDRGSQFGSSKFKDAMKVKGFIQSMSRKGDCWDNACVESFFHLMKSEELNFIKFENKEQVRWAVFKYIEVFYNRKRIHSVLGYNSPTDFEKKYIA